MTNYSNAQALTPEQLVALQAFALKYKRGWKRELLDRWLDGRDAREPMGYALRQIRNQLGPSWLCDLSANPAKWGEGA